MNENGKYLNFKGKGYSISFDFEKNNNYSIIKKFFNEIFHNYQLQVNFSKDIIANGNLLKNNPSFIKFKKDLKSIDKKKNYKNEFSTRLQI